jgi:hypothetical protein
MNNATPDLSIALAGELDVDPDSLRSEEEILDSDPEFQDWIAGRHEYDIAAMIEDSLDW